MAYQGKRRLLDELKLSLPPGGLDSWQPYLHMMHRKERPNHWQLQASPCPPKLAPPRVTHEEIV